MDRFIFHSFSVYGDYAECILYEVPLRPTLLDEMLTPKRSQATLKTFVVLFILDELIDGNYYELMWFD
jgi:hypothetical protein